MTWDPNQPANATKLRNAPGVIQNNWNAIEQADTSFEPQGLNLADRTALALGDPTPIATSYIAYCKQDPAGSPQLFGIDKDGIISQFTSSVRDLTSNGYAIIAPGIMMQWGTSIFTNPSGALTETIIFEQAYPSPAWVVNLTIKGNTVSGSTPHPFGVTNITSTSFDATQLNGVSGVSAFNFNWIAIGPAPV